MLGAAAATGEAWQNRGRLHTWYLNETGACGPAPPDPPGADATVVTGSLKSATVQGDVGYAIATPTGSNPATLPLVVCLPGRGSTAESTMSDLRLADYAALAPHPLAVASVDGGETYWHPRTSGEDRMSMLVHEFLPLLRKIGRAHV